MMKVNVGNQTYLVHFETRKHQAKTEDKLLSDVTCVVRTMGKEPVLEGVVKQNYQDSCDLVYARKLAFGRAIGTSCSENRRFNKDERTEFWNQFKKECRYKKVSKKVGYQKGDGCKKECKCKI